LAVLLRLLRDVRQPLRITVAEPRARLGLGVAYSTGNAMHLLNGPARIFSIYEDDAQHFTRWLRVRALTGGWAPPPGMEAGDSLPPRRVYGDYLSDTLAQALARVHEGIEFRHVRQRVVALEAHVQGQDYVARLADGSTLEAQQVVLATGVFNRSELPFTHDEAVLSSTRYVADIWAPGSFDAVDKDETIAFLGSGLSSLDALITAEQAGFSGRYTAISRRGQEVQERREVTPWPDFLQYDPAGIRLPDLLRQIRVQRHEIAARGEDPQCLTMSIKAHVAKLWELSPERQKRRFLDRLRPYWDTALHRSAPESLAWQEAAHRQGRYTSLRSRIIGLRLDSVTGKIAVEHRPAGASHSEVALFDRVINCLGFEFDWRKTDDPLIRHLLDAGLVRVDPLGFGIQVDRQRLRALNAAGQVQQGLYAVGHALRGVFWESNAIPEQVPQAGLVAKAIVDAVHPLARARRLADALARRAEAADRSNELSVENIEDIRQAGLCALAVPASLGGLEQDLGVAVELIGELGRNDPPSALILLMQIFHHRWILASPNWPARLREEVLRGAVRNGDLINALRVEPVQGSPVRGGLPSTLARRVPQGWLLNGRKIYSTGAEVLRWGLVWAATDETQPRVGEFLVPMHSPGVRIEKTWDHLGLRGSGSHDVVFEDVLVPSDHGADLRLPQEWSTSGDELGAWLPLMLAALYDGVARNARDWLVGWSQQRRPSNLAGSLAELPRFAAGVGEIDALLFTNRALLEQAVQTSSSQAGGVMAGLVKYSATRNAIQVVQQVLSLAGNHGLTRHNPVERHLRDVLCGRVHHPQDDLILDKAGRFAFAA
jgi:uncharacterized NAD(P)/FAD-binding protein YdhS/alkylation response protein AidB-like acyl-CoA dehydrogenase